MNQEKNKIDLFRLIATIIAGIIASLPIVLGIILLLYGTIFTLPFAITYFIIPLGFFALEFFLLKSSHTKAAKIILSVVMVVLFVFGSLFAFSMTPLESLVSYEGEEALQEYSHISIAALPSVADLGQPEKIEYIQFEHFQFIFISESDYLICQYNTENYQQQKDSLQQRYVFQESTVDVEYNCSPTFSLGDYNFRMLSLEEDRYELWYPKYLSFVATNDKTHEIVYLYFTNLDLDCISSMEEFLLGDCGWEHIR